MVSVACVGALPACDRARPDNAGYTSSDTGQTSTASTIIGTTGPSIAPVEPEPPGPLEKACPDTADIFSCTMGVLDTKVSEDCVIKFTSEWSPAPFVLVDCELVPRFFEDEGAAGAPQEAENWSHSLGGGDGGSTGGPDDLHEVVLYGSWCDRARQGARVDVVQQCPYE